MAVTDYWWLDVHIEMMTLRDYLDLLDNQLMTLIERERERIWQGVDPDDREASDGALYQDSLLEQGISIRFLSAAGLIAVWAVYECTVSALSERLRAARTIELKLGDLKGSFLEQAERYFGDVLRFTLHASDADLKRLRSVLTVRNALAHTNGRLEDVKPKQRETLTQLVAADSSLIMRDGYLIASRKYVRNVWELVERLLSDLTTRVYEEVANTH